jgi:hypothetical protein
MRNIIAVGAIAATVLLASFGPISWSTPAHPPTVLASISPTNLTLGAGTLLVSTQVDAF